MQLDSFLIASQQSADRLRNASQAKILVYSDSHGGRQVVNRVISYFGSSVDCIAFCGDGMSDLISVLELCAVENNAEKSCVPPVVAFVCGNNDSQSYPAALPPNAENIQHIKVPSSLVFEACGHKIFLVHGHRYGVYSALERLECEAEVIGADFVFFGHTHIPQVEHSERKKTLFLNPGSLCLPRGNSFPSLAMVTVYAGEKSADVAFFKIDQIMGKEYYRLYDPEYIPFRLF